MPIYEYYCPDNHRIYQFFAKTLAQGKSVPRCPDNPKYRMEKIVSRFAVMGRSKSDDAQPNPGGDPGGESGNPAEDARMEAAMGAMEQEFSSVDENDPKSMGRMMRRMSELTGEKLDGEMEEVVRKLEEGADPESLEDEMGGSGPEGDENGMGDPSGMGGPGAGAPPKDPREPRQRLKASKGPPARDPKLYDYD